MRHVSLPLCQHPASNFLHFALKGKTNTPLLLHLFFVQKPMKPKLLWCSLFIIIFFVLAVSATSARPLVQSQGGDEKPKQILERALDSKLEDNSIDELMGSETCGDGDEECLKRRLLSEAHLDYIYTQEHKP